ncbi:MAG: outer membrane beta-barrel domain-containing protein [Zetaproteobacteria bacterium]|nr:outer membrane beta-barrel domain-containing protein [Zetaproteobacteria bacterium]
MRTKPIFLLALATNFLFVSLTATLTAQSAPPAKRTKKATEDDDEVVRNKLYPKISKFEIGVLDLGYIFNQSFVESFIAHTNANYYFREDWGISIEAAMSMNSDKPERTCIENFYNDYEGRVSQPCALPGQDPTIPITESYDTDGTPIAYRGASGGPAYIPIRELGTMLNIAAVWTPVYGKQLLLQSNTLYLDLFFTFGAGITNSEYYPMQKELANGNVSRGRPPNQIGQVCTAPPLPGVCPEDPNFASYVGVNGRPAAQSESTPTLTMGIGQKIHFWNSMHLKTEIRSYTLVGTDAGIDPFLMAWLGIGVRL